MTPPQYESVSGKYEITASDSPYESIELGASGDYIVTSKGYSSYIASAKQTFIFKSAPASRATTSGNLTYGTYTQVSEGTFNLEGFGTIQLKAGDNGEIESIAISVDGATKEYTTEKAETMGDDNKTNSLCRTWRVVKTHDKGYDPYEGDYDITDVSVAVGFKTLSTFSTCFKAYYGMTPREYMKQKAQERESGDAEGA